MQSRSIHLPIGPSDWQRACDASLGLGGVLLALWQLEPVIALGVASAAVSLCVWRWERPAPRTLHVIEHAGRIQGQWYGDTERATPVRALRCDYLGPCLMGINVGGERLWLWPDSAPREAQRELRRLLLQSPER